MKKEVKYKVYTKYMLRYTTHTQNKLVGENKLIWYSNIHTIYKVRLNKIYTGVIRSDKQLGLENQ